MGIRHAILDATHAAQHATTKDDRDDTTRRSGPAAIRDNSVLCPRLAQYNPPTRSDPQQPKITITWGFAASLPSNKQRVRSLVAAFYCTLRCGLVRVLGWLLGNRLAKRERRYFAASIFTCWGGSPVYPDPEFLGSGIYRRTESVKSCQPPEIDECDAMSQL